MKTFRFNQNNSGGHYVGPQRFETQALTVDHAWLELAKQSWFTESFCECCGRRWSKFDCDVLSPSGEWRVAR